MIKKDSYQQAVDLIDKSERILITTHTKPDGDALGCLVAMCDVLGTLGKKVKCLLLSPAPDWYQFLLTEKVPVLDEDIQLEELTAGRFGEFDLIIILDTNSPEQLPKFKEYLKQNEKPILVIDHHRTSDGLGAVELVESDAAATALVVLALFKYAGWEITGKIAEALFVATATDTGWFQFNNTNGSVFSACAQLINIGIKPDQIHTKLYRNFSFERFQLMLRVLGSLKLHFDGRYACLQLKREDLKETGASYRDTENLIDECKRIGSVEVIALFTELEDDQIRCSMRSTNSFNVCDIMLKFGGGGHAKAAASSHRGQIEDIMRKIYTEIKKLFT